MREEGKKGSVSTGCMVEADKGLPHSVLRCVFILGKRLEGIKRTERGKKLVNRCFLKKL